MLRRLLTSERGATALEFAFVLPPMLILLMGGSEVVYQAYVQSILDGAMQKAGRDSAIQGGAQQAPQIDQRVLGEVRVVAPQAVIHSTNRRSYSSFSAMKPERFTDDNSNGRRDATECFEDTNGNRSWDADPATAGQGGANDVTLYIMQIRYGRLFPVTGFLGWDGSATLSARTLLKNQPFASQAPIAVRTICD